MAQDFAKAFYHSPAWLRVRKNYMGTVVDTSGRRLHMSADGYAYTDEHGHVCRVPSSSVVAPGLCERCFRMGRVTPAKVVHHIEHLTPENIGDRGLTLSYSNLMRVCQDCHAFLHSGHDEPRVTFDEQGNVVPVCATPEEEFRMQLERLTETDGGRRNIHRGSHGR